ncbi:c-type cytochrome [Sphingomonas sanxanigenens]|nr:c-type cytochrome [Sphingomonas sanxanigenens]
MRGVGCVIALAALTLTLSGCGDGGRAERRAALGPNPTFADYRKAADPAHGARLFNACAGCHPISPGALDRGGPNLFGIMGKPVATASRRFGYSGALRAVGGRWTPELMDRWVADPRKLAPRTSMNFQGIGDPLDRADLIAWMETQGR